MTFSQQDDAAILLTFLPWLTRQPDRATLRDSALVRRFLEQRQAQVVSCYVASQAGT